MHNALWTILISFLDKPELLLLKSKVLKAQRAKARGRGLTAQVCRQALPWTYPAHKKLPKPQRRKEGDGQPQLRWPWGVHQAPLTQRGNNHIPGPLLHPPGARGSQPSPHHCFPSPPDLPCLPNSPLGNLKRKIFPLL